LGCHANQKQMEEAFEKVRKGYERNHRQKGAKMLYLCQFNQIR